MKKINIIVILVIAVLISTTISLQGTAAEQTEALEDERYNVLQQAEQNIESPMEEVIDNQNDLEQYINNTNVSFDTHKVAVIALGQRNTGGYSIEIVDVNETEDSVTITYRENTPGEDEMVTQALTYPSKIVEVETNDRELNIEQEETNNDLGPETLNEAMHSEDWEVVIQNVDGGCFGNQTTGVNDVNFLTEDDQYVAEIEGTVQTSNPCYDIGVEDVIEDDNDFRLEINTESQDVVCVECVGYITYEARLTADQMNELEIVHDGEVVDTREHPNAETVGIIRFIVNWFSSLF